MKCDACDKDLTLIRECYRDSHDVVKYVFYCGFCAAAYTNEDGKTRVTTGGSSPHTAYFDINFAVAEFGRVFRIGRLVQSRHELTPFGTIPER